MKSSVTSIVARDIELKVPKLSVLTVGTASGTNRGIDARSIYWGLYYSDLLRKKNIWSPIPGLVLNITCLRSAQILEYYDYVARGPLASASTVTSSRPFETLHGAGTQPTATLFGCKQGCANTENS